MTFFSDYLQIHSITYFLFLQLITQRSLDRETKLSLNVFVKPKNYMGFFFHTKLFFFKQFTETGVFIDAICSVVFGSYSANVSYFAPFTFIFLLVYFILFRLFNIATTSGWFWISMKSVVGEILQANESSTGRRAIIRVIDSEPWYSLHASHRSVTMWLILLFLPPHK